MLELVLLSYWASQLNGKGILGTGISMPLFLPENTLCSLSEKFSHSSTYQIARKLTRKKKRKFKVGHPTFTTFHLRH